MGFACVAFASQPLLPFEVVKAASMRRRCQARGWRRLRWADAGECDRVQPSYQKRDVGANFVSNSFTAASAASQGDTAVAAAGGDTSLHPVTGCGSVAAAGTPHTGDSETVGVLKLTV